MVKLSNLIWCHDGFGWARRHYIKLEYNMHLKCKVCCAPNTGYTTSKVMYTLCTLHQFIITKLSLSSYVGRSWSNCLFDIFFHGIASHKYFNLILITIHTIERWHSVSNVLSTNISRISTPGYGQALFKELYSPSVVTSLTFERYDFCLIKKLFISQIKQTLVHSQRVTYLWVCKIISIGSNNGLAHI